MAYILLLGVVILLLLLLARRLSETDAHFLFQVLRWTIFMIFVFAIIILLATGRVAYAGGALLLFALMFGAQLKIWFKKLLRIREALPSKMDEREARDILGLEDDATQKDIQDAYHRLIALNHPDKGGSSYMAAKLNEAREILQKEKKK